MKNLTLSQETKDTDGWDSAYRQAVIDMMTKIGDTQEALVWLWKDVAAQQS